MFEDIKNKLHELRINAAAKALESNGFKTYVSLSRAEAKEIVMKLIPEGSVVGVGGSATIRELNIVEELERRGIKVIHHWVKVSPEESLEIRRKALTSDVYLSSSNAVTLDGKLINIDASGNRVAALMFGPKKVIIVVGRNKLTRNLEEGLLRARNIAGVANAIRLNYKTPCTTLGYCVECKNAEKPCNVVVIMERKPSNTDVHVVLVNDDLGF
ncbi:MAG: lactate utilization protein [Sulfolobales archaeon]|nr:lactate utilization protein [Sulfolobales archaeon]MCX8185982.1 lactate utilization protein [Sulfolobales archaeon]MDW7969239.1 lactate utilization protein [Sulfolobales archaeon]